MVEFARWVDAFCPPNNQLGAEPIVCCTRESQDCSAVMRLHYATNYSDASHLRPYMCAWRADTGCSGFFEPDLALMLMELILSEGCPGHLNLIYSVCVTKPKKNYIHLAQCLSPRFLSDPDLPGCEKVAATQIPQEYLDAEYVALPSLDGLSARNIGLKRRCPYKVPFVSCPPQLLETLGFA